MRSTKHWGYRDRQKKDRGHRPWELKKIKGLRNFLGRRDEEGEPEDFPSTVVSYIGFNSTSSGTGEV